jgi:hypothetical protein
MEDRLSEQPILGLPLRRLAEAGLECPAHLPLSKFLRLLAEEGLLSQATAADLAAAHQAMRYGGESIDEDRLQPTVQALDREIEVKLAGEPQIVQRLARRLRKSASTTASEEVDGEVAETEPQPEAPVEVAPTPADLSADRDPSQHLSDRPSRAPGRRFRLGSQLVAIVMLVLASIGWSLLMIGVGYVGSDAIEGMVDAVDYHFLGGVRPPRPITDQLDELRSAAGMNPHSRQHWQRFADFAYEHQSYADAIMGYNHLLSLTPDDPRVLNSLAWLHCTAQEPWARDPIRALALAERAHALDPSPGITDTLAEAAYLNGDHQRAIALEEDALSRLEGDDRFYREQLAKFRAAAQKLRPSPAGPSVSAEP